jgi:hypothetical protein
MRRIQADPGPWPSRCAKLRRGLGCVLRYVNTSSWEGTVRGSSYSTISQNSTQSCTQGWLEAATPDTYLALNAETASF